ncbi:MAG: hypothetical protein SNJ82_07940, partial [Gemmataceae bacterium]
MIAALLWKEYREQRLIWLVFVVLTAAALACTPIFDAEVRNYACLTIVLVAAATQAVVCGAMLLAGEREEKTEAFLDLLAVRRGGLWWGKLLAGFLLALGWCGLFMLALLLFSDLPPWQVATVPLAACYGLAWGLWGGTRSRTVLGGILSGVFTGLLVAPVVVFVVLIPFRLAELDRNLLDGVLLPAMLSFFYLVLPSVWAYWRYTLPDRLRWLDHARADKADRDTPSVWWTCLQLAWHLQARHYLVVLVLAIALALGTLLLPLPLPLLLWPIGSALLGVLLGITLFAEEQAGPHRFLADQRLPLGTLWSTRVGLAGGGLTFLIVSQATTLLYVWLTQRASVDLKPPFVAIGLPLLCITIPVASWLLLWPVTGFAVAALVGLLFRKVLVAMVVAAGLTALLVSGWLPSLLVGGLLWWQPLMVPLLLLVTTRLLMPRWATGRSMVLPLLACGSLALLLTAAGLAYRVYSVPLVRLPERLQPFLAELPPVTEGSEQ